MIAWRYTTADRTVMTGSDIAVGKNKVKIVTFLSKESHKAGP